MAYARILGNCPENKTDPTQERDLTLLPFGIPGGFSQKRVHSSSIQARAFALDEDLDEQRALPASLLDSPGIIGSKKKFQDKQAESPTLAEATNSLFEFPHSFALNGPTLSLESGSLSSSDYAYIPRSLQNTDDDIGSEIDRSSASSDNFRMLGSSVDSLSSHLQSMSFCVGSYNSGGQPRKNSGGGVTDIWNRPSTKCIRPSLSRHTSEWGSSASRSLKISNIPKNLDPIIIVDYFQNFGGINGFCADDMRKEGTCIVVFCDLADSIKVFSKLKVQPAFDDVLLDPAFCSMYEIAQMYRNGLQMPLFLENDGIISITNNTSSADLKAALGKVLATFGSIRSLQDPSCSSGCKFLTCEYFDIRSAEAAVSTLNGLLLEGNMLQVSFFGHQDNLTQAALEYIKLNEERGSLLQLSGARLSLWSLQTDHLSPLGRKVLNFLQGRNSMPKAPVSHTLNVCKLFRGKLTALNGSDDGLDSPNLHCRRTDTSQSVKVRTGVSTSGLGDSASSYAGGDCRSLWNSSPNKDQTGYMNGLDTPSAIVTSASVPKKNAVDLVRIARGLDTRTTLMVRNIPNKVDQLMLKEYIDVTNKGTYEFLYLRIDFVNRCNVGYAFISFTSPEHIITFAKARAGTKWNRFNSEKTCDICYANIQGKDCLIEKFRNSSVMDQDPAYRPKIYASDGLYAGEEEEFPAPNNLNRKLRSLASIQQIGLKRAVGAHNRK